MVIMPPSTSFFKLRYDKIGRVGPGMSQTIHVDFWPVEQRYYYDTIRLSLEAEGGEAEHMAVPIHAYPVANVTNVPRSIDFGRCFVSEPVSKTFEVSCSVPIQFE
jgi:hypothetical protein